MANEIYEKTQYILEDFYGNSFDINSGDELGKIIRGKYTIEKTIGDGLNSKLYLVSYQDKKYIAKIMTDKSCYQYLENEYNILKNISSDNVVKTITFYEENPVEPPILLLEYIEGEKPNKNISFLDKIKFILQLSNIYFQLEKENIIHGDIKGDNIIIDSKGNIKLIDFGLGNSYDNPKGTVKYIAPETLTKGVKNIRSEIYSFCVFVFEFLYEYPYKGKDIKEGILYKNIELGEDIWIRLLLSKGLHKDASMRYSSFGEIMEVLAIVNFILEKENADEDYETFSNSFYQFFPQKELKIFYYNYYLYTKGKTSKLNSLDSIRFLIDLFIIHYSFRIQKEALTIMNNELSKIYPDLMYDNLYQYTKEKIKETLNKLDFDIELKKAEELQKTLQPKEAIRIYKKLILKGSVEAEYSMALMYRQGKGVEIDKEKYLVHLKNLAEIDHAQSLYQLGLAFQKGEDFDIDYREAKNYYEKAASLGHLGSQNNLGIFYRFGYGCEKDYEKAFYWFKKAAEGGHVGAQNNLGFMYKNGYGCEKDYEQAFYWYRLSSEEGNSSAQVNLAFLFREGLGTEHDLEKAFYWYKKASENGNTTAIVNLGKFYQEGWGTRKDYALAAKLYKAGAKENNDLASTYLAYLYQYGLGVEKNEALAKTLYEKVIKKGFSTAQYYYGRFLIEASSKDYELGIKYLKKSAKQKNTDAQLYLAKLFLEGKVVIKSFTNAKKWYEIAINEGSSQGLYEMGRIYFEGKEVLQNYKKAFAYTYQGAKLGNKDAQSFLGYLYENGYGTKKDMGEALMWKNLAGVTREANPYESSFVEESEDKVEKVEAEILENKDNASSDKEGKGRRFSMKNLFR
jgi:TPR repeat protein/predicted Ser/Thr protein kinase